MPSYLILRLEAPFAAFGDIMVDALGPTAQLPSVAMLTGLLGNALGYRREQRQCLQRLQDRLVHASRLDFAAGRLTDNQNARIYQDDEGWTTRGVPIGREPSPSYSKGPDGRKSLINQRWREHLSDACVHIAIALTPAEETPDLAALASALESPARPLFIGRKSCLPSAPILYGLVNADDLLGALLAVPLDKTERAKSGKILIDLPRSENRPEGFERKHCCDRRDWVAGVHTGDSIRWSGHLSASAFEKGVAA